MLIPRASRNPRMRNPTHLKSGFWYFTPVTSKYYFDS